MPLLWKKAKTTRMSRMVADLQSPKRGGSLVVETGFPTSLIDLFVKNRDRLRKPSIKKRKNKNKNDNVLVDDDDDSTNDTNRVVDRAPAVVPDEVEIPSGVVLDATMPEKTARVGVEILAAMVGVLAVAFLALSTKKLAVVVTLSAFALLLVELVIGRRRKSGGDHESESDEDEEFIAARLPAIRFGDEGVLTSSKTRNEGQDQVPGLILEKSKSKSKRAKIRRKIIKNFVPKKLRTANKKRKKANMEANAVEEESPELLGEEADESVEMSVEDDDDGEEDEEQDRDQEFWTLLTILGVVLLGLCWGRVFSLVLTIAWCVGIKLIGFIRRVWEAFRKVSSE